MAITHTETVSNLTVLNDGTDVVSQVEIKTVSVDDSDPSTLTKTSYDNYTVDTFTAGYFNTTSAITAMRFQYGTGNIDSGTIKLYGVT